MTSPDLQRLFRLLPSEASTPREDFTSEALRKAIRSDPRPLVRLLAAMPASAWRLASGVLTVDLSRIASVTAETQVPLPQITEHDAGRLDLVVGLEDLDGIKNTVWVEVKIDAALNRHRPGKLVAALPPECHELAMRAGRDQLDVYLLHRCLEASPRPILMTLAKVAPFHDEVTGITRDDITGTTWEDVVSAVQGTPDPHAWWVDLVDFLRAESIVPRRLPLRLDDLCPDEVERLVPVYDRVNRTIKTLWADAPMNIHWTGIQGVVRGGKRLLTGGPMIWGLRSSVAGWEWWILLGNAGYPGVSVLVDEVIDAATAGGLPDTWQRASGWHGDRFGVWEKARPFIADEPDQLPIDWLSEAMRELHRARMFEPHFRQVRAKIARDAERKAKSDVVAVTLEAEATSGNLARDQEPAT